MCKTYNNYTYPYGYLSFALHFVITDAAKPANKAVQSKNIWKESDMSPKLEERDKLMNHIKIDF